MKLWGSRKTLWVCGWMCVGFGLFLMAAMGLLFLLLAGERAAVPALFAALGLSMTAAGGASAAHSRAASDASRTALRVCCALACAAPLAAAPLLALEGLGRFLPACLLGALVAAPLYVVAYRFDRGDDRPLVSFDPPPPAPGAAGPAPGEDPPKKKRPVVAIVSIAVLAGLLLFNGCVRLELMASRDDWRRDAAELERREKELKDLERSMDRWDPGRAGGAAEGAPGSPGPQAGRTRGPAEGRAS